LLAHYQTLCGISEDAVSDHNKLPMPGAPWLHVHLLCLLILFLFKVGIIHVWKLDCVTVWRISRRQFVFMKKLSFL